MKKIFLTAVALLTMASAQVFGMYYPSSGSWIGFLTDGNQLRARMSQFGFTLGNGTIKGTFGFANGGTEFLSTSDGLYYNFKPTISMGIGYTSDPISVGLGYGATIATNKWTKSNGKKTEAVAHTPVLVLNAMNNSFRMAVPISVVRLSNRDNSVTALNVDAQFRYFTGLDALSQIRLIVRYGNFGYQTKNEDGTTVKGKSAESFGFTFRLDFLKTVLDEVTIAPFFTAVYNTALGRQHRNRNFNAVSSLNDVANFNISSTEVGYGVGSWNFSLTPALGLSAGNDIVSVYLEPALGLNITQPGHESQKIEERYGLAYAAYAEIYIQPVSSLLWYFILGANNTGSGSAEFYGDTGFTWYLPTFNN